MWKAKPSNETFIKVEKLFDLLDELELSIDYRHAGFIVNDGKHEWMLKEVEDGRIVRALPSGLEYNLVLLERGS